jgi:hypothetical protein
VAATRRMIAPSVSSAVTRKSIARRRDIAEVQAPVAAALPHACAAE